MSNRTAIQTSPVDACTSWDGALLGGKYRLQRLLGEGGMGNVWLAQNELLELPVAIKILRPDLRGTEAAARMLTEARVQAKLHHPHVVRVFDYGETPAGDAYIVMELLEGVSLAEWLETRGALPPVVAIQLLLPVIDALCAAHRAGVIHRDLKPDNVFLATGGDQLCPKLLDFGIAKLAAECAPRLTSPNGVLGSPAYMAPEQARGEEDLDERVDVWSACVVLYECISGQPAYDANNYHALLRSVIERDLPPLQAAGCEGLWQILSAGLKRDRNERIASMHDLGAALAGWLAARGEREDACRQPLSWRWQLESEQPHVPSLPTPPRQQTGLRDSEASPTLRITTGSRRAALLRVLQRGLHSRSALQLSLATCIVAGCLVVGLWHPAEPDAEGKLAQALELATSPAAVASAADTPQPVPPPPAAQPKVATPQAPPVPVAQPAPELVRLTSTRVVQAEPPEAHYVAPAPQPPAASESASDPKPLAKPVLVIKRRAPATEAELGLKNPW
ncbi:MAG TPA: serine/threonine-protein kinase [Polyangiales bacterium]|nr:serine/threonine-protein kinase [Polyangiales bacterium]